MDIRICSQLFFHDIFTRFCYDILTRQPAPVSLILRRCARRFQSVCRSRLGKWTDFYPLSLRRFESCRAFLMPACWLGLRNIIRSAHASAWAHMNIRCSFPRCGAWSGPPVRPQRNTRPALSEGGYRVRTPLAKSNAFRLRAAALNPSAAARYWGKEQPII